jgi:hypothetical protein
MAEHQELRKVEDALSEIRSATEETWKNNLRGLAFSALGWVPALLIVYFIFQSPRGQTAGLRHSSDAKFDWD